MGKSTQKTATQTSTPWQPQIPYLKEIMGKAQGLYKSDDPTVAPMSAQTSQGLDQITNIANAGDPNLAGSQAALGELLNGSGVAGDALTATARGDFLGAPNPYLQDLINSQSSRISDQVKAQFGGAGRYGSTNFAQALADRLGSFSSQILSNNYEQERDRQMAAAGVLSNNRLSALGIAPTINSMRYSDAAQLLGAGQQMDAYNQAQLDDPWMRLQRYAGLITGSGSGGTITKTEPGPSILSQILGGVVGLGGVIGKLSDARAKTDIRRVGWTDGGTPIVVYRYRDGGPMEFGVLAQDVLRTQPEAVSVRPDGYLAVDYGALV